MLVAIHMGEIHWEMLEESMPMIVDLESYAFNLICGEVGRKELEDRCRIDWRERRDITSCMAIAHKSLVS